MNAIRMTCASRYLFACSMHCEACHLAVNAVNSHTVFCSAQRPKPTGGHADVGKQEDM